MNPHALLLLLMIALLTTTWHHDQARVRTSRQMAAAVSRSEQQYLLVRRPDARPQQTVVRNEVREPKRQISVSTVSAARPELPAGIAPGRYRVVSHSGDVKTVTITPAEAGINADSLPRRDFYIQADGAQRWYFIRIESDREI